MPHYGRHGYDYWHQNAEGRLIVGGFRDADMDSEFTATEATTDRIQGALDAFAEDLLGRKPDLARDGLCGERSVQRRRLLRARRSDHSAHYLDGRSAPARCSIRACWTAFRG